MAIHIMVRAADSPNNVQIHYEDITGEFAAVPGCHPLSDFRAHPGDKDVGCCEVCGTVPNAEPFLSMWGFKVFALRWNIPDSWLWRTPLISAESQIGEWVAYWAGFMKNDINVEVTWPS